ncbi:hypothetical protein [Kribbella monticola]|uniref:hypothetical protein n=1 Tax=Kribbella monticola TaxID=2185285 RepID=UPI000DD4ABB5|nr:hypothetical protein [Kribbella monticola]
MTQDLKTRLDEATDRPTAFVPDLDHLLAAGRRRARSHFAVTIAGTVAAVAVAATAGAIALNQGGGSGPNVLPAPPAGQATSATPTTTTRCLDEAGQPSPKGADKWESMVTVKDKYGSSTVRRSAGQLAFCSEFSGKPTIVTQQVMLPRSSVWLMSVCRTDPSCTDIVTVFMGRLPANAVRVAVTPAGGGKPVDATTRKGFFAYRWIDVPDLSRPATARIYDSAGRELGHYRV